MNLLQCLIQHLILQPLILTCCSLTPESQGISPITQQLLLQWSKVSNRDTCQGTHLRKNKDRSEQPQLTGLTQQLSLIESSLRYQLWQKHKYVPLQEETTMLVTLTCCWGIGRVLGNFCCSVVRSLSGRSLFPQTWQRFIMCLDCCWKWAEAVIFELMRSSELVSASCQLGIFEANSSLIFLTNPQR